MPVDILNKTGHQHGFAGSTLKEVFFFNFVGEPHLQIDRVLPEANFHSLFRTTSAEHIFGPPKLSECYKEGAGSTVYLKTSLGFLLMIS